MPSEEERALVRELAERGVSVRFATELPFKSADELAPAETVLLEALRAAEDERLIQPLALAPRHPRFRAALPILVEKLGDVESTAAEGALVHAITTLGLEGYEAEVARAHPRVQSRMIRTTLEAALRKAGHEPASPQGAEAPVLGARGRSVVGATLLALGVGCLVAAGWLVLRGSLTPELRALAALQGVAFLLFGAALLRRARWSLGAYICWCVAAIAFQHAFQVTYRFLPETLFWVVEAGFVVALVAVGSYYWPDLHPHGGGG